MEVDDSKFGKFEGLTFNIPKEKGYWELDPHMRLYRPHRPSLWKQFWMFVFFEIKWRDDGRTKDTN